MKTTILMMGSAMLFSGSLLAQEIEYINPPAIQGDKYKLELSDIVSQKDYCKLKMSLTNSSQDHYLRYDFSKTAFHYGDANTYYSARGKDMVIAPNDKKSGVAEVKGNAGFLVHAFELRPEGLSTAKIPNEPLPIPNFAFEVGKSNSNSQNGFEIATIKVEQSKKKDKVTAQLSIRFSGQANELGLVNLKNAVVLDPRGNRVGEFSLAPDKIQELLTGDDFKLNINITSTETSFTLSWVDAFKLLSFESNAINPIAIRSANAPKQATTAAVVGGPNTNCGTFVGEKTGKVKVTIYSVDAECFSLTINGVAISDKETTNATLYMDYGKKDAIFKFSNGVVFEDKFTIPQTLAEGTYRLKKNAKGEYSLSFDNSAMVLNELGLSNVKQPLWEVLFSNDDVSIEIDANAIVEENGIHHVVVRSVYSGGATYGGVTRYGLIVTDRFDINCSSSKPIKVIWTTAIDGDKKVIEDEASGTVWQTPSGTQMEKSVDYICKKR